MPAHVKVVALLIFTTVVVATPKDVVAAFAVYLALLLALVVVSGVPAPYFLKRMVVEVPFLAFALMMPFVATGPQIQIAGLNVSEPGLHAAWGLVVKGMLGVLASLLLAATTEPYDLLRALERLRVPHQLVQIMSFMVRYLDVVTDEMRRMRNALQARGFVAGNPRHWPVLARSAGALFIRSYERGERVHLAMLARGKR
jgi:cobalt/nickel transport system permease protein